MTRAVLRLLMMGAIVAAPSLGIAQTPAQTPAPTSAPSPAPQLTERGADSAPPDTEVDAGITAQVTIPTEAEGQYTLGRHGATVEVDFEQRGLTGYLTILGDEKTDKRSALTFFFAKTRIGGDNIYFATHEIHRSWYEFTGVVGQTPPREKSLEVGYSLDGVLTLHRMEADGSDSKMSKRVKFKKMD